MQHLTSDLLSQNPPAHLLPDTLLSPFSSRAALLLSVLVCLPSQHVVPEILSSALFFSLSMLNPRLSHPSLFCGKRFPHLYLHPELQSFWAPPHMVGSLWEHHTQYALHWMCYLLWYFLPPCCCFTVLLCLQSSNPTALFKIYFPLNLYLLSCQLQSPNSLPLWFLS